MLLESNARYEADIVLGTLESFAGNDLIADKLRSVGFVDVAVTGSGKNRKAVGRWDKLMQDVTLPPQVKKVVKI